MFVESSAAGCNTLLRTVTHLAASGEIKSVHPSFIGLRLCQLPLTFISSDLQIPWLTARSTLECTPKAAPASSTQAEAQRGPRSQSTSYSPSFEGMPACPTKHPQLSCRSATVSWIQSTMHFRNTMSTTNHPQISGWSSSRLRSKEGNPLPNSILRENWLDPRAWIQNASITSSFSSGVYPRTTCCIKSELRYAYGRCETVEIDFFSVSSSTPTCPRRAWTL